MTKLFAAAFPILPGQTDRWLKFSNALKTEKNKEFKESRKRLGVHERSFLQHTPMGDFVVVTLEGENPEAAFTKFNQGNDAFTQWFVKEVSAIHGVDFNKLPPGPVSELIVDSGELKLMMA